jgi:hypothetical protein
MSYRALNASEIVKTISVLEHRINERFPKSGLTAVCHELLNVGEATQRNAQAIAVPNLWLRGLIYVAIIAGIVGLVVVAQAIIQSINVQVGTEVFGFFQGINITVLVGAALFFAVSFDDRMKRRRALSELHVFRSIAHVIDMHQLTKDPSVVLGHYHATATSPKRIMKRFELTRYLDYCSEMLALTGKLATLYAQSLPDQVVIDAVNDIEILTANLSGKIWQKITILESLEEKEDQRMPSLQRS